MIVIMDCHSTVTLQGILRVVSIGKTNAIAIIEINCDFHLWLLPYQWASRLLIYFTGYNKWYKYYRDEISKLNCPYDLFYTAEWVNRISSCLYSFYRVLWVLHLLQRQIKHILHLSTWSLSGQIVITFAQWPSRPVTSSSSLLQGIISVAFMLK